MRSAPMRILTALAIATAPVTLGACDDDGTSSEDVEQAQANSRL